MKAHLLFFSILLLSNQKDVRGQNKVMKCSTANERCQLPFVFREKQYEACTPDGAGSKQPWCPTKIYGNGSADVHYCMECWGEQRCYYTGDFFSDSSWTLSCPPGCQYVQKNTYGTNNEFSAASQICAAAIHEGLFKNDTGGQVILQKKPWKKNFVGADKNGIQTYAGRKENIPMMNLKVGNIPQTPRIVFTHDRAMISSLPYKSVTSEILNDKQTFAYGITSDVGRGKIFWSDVGKRSIFSANFNGKKLSQIKVILKNEQVLKPEVLAYDWIHQNLFWTDVGLHSVSVADSDGENVLTLIKRDNFDPRGLALDPRNGYFYVADFGDSPKIEKCAMFKKDQCETIIHEDITSPSGVAIDIQNNQLCWADTKLSQISCANLDGSRRRNMKFSSERLKQPFALVAYSGRIYWTDWLTTTMASADAQTWDNFHIHLGDITKAAGLTAFERKAQPVYENHCTNSACQHLCVPREEGYMCLCSDGNHLSPDGSCQGGPLPDRGINVYVADYTSLTRLDVQLTTHTSKPVKILRNAQKVVAVSVDTQKNVIYWSEATAKKINFAPISDNLVKQTMLHGDSGYVSQVEGIAIDSISRLLYWTDVSLHAVFVTNLDPKAGQHHIRVLVKGTNSFVPRGIALDPKRGYFYVVDSKSPYAIQRCENSGEGCKTLAISQLYQPQMIAIDFDADRLYFTQYVNNARIVSTDLDGSNRKVIPSRHRQAYGIGVFQKRVYVSDITLRQVVSMNKDNGLEPHIITRSVTRPMGIFIHDPEDKKPAGYQNVCAGNCRYLCVPTPSRGGKSHTCLCPERFKGIMDAPECEAEEPVTPKPVPDCKAGHRPSKDKKLCTDIDECAENIDGCQQVCRNTLGSFFCDCHKGFDLQADEKSCLRPAGPVEPCANNPCKNGGTCQEKDDKSGYVCFCDVGFKGDDCDKLDVRIARIDQITGAILLQCICPKGVLSEILWIRNRLPIDPAERWALRRDRGRQLTMMRPYYTHSGNFTCQFQYQGFEHRATELVIIKASPSIACGESVGPDDPERERKGEKVLGGRITKTLHAPFVAMLYKKTGDPLVPKGVFCGGSIIDTKHIVTAAHCFQSVSYLDVTVYVGKLMASVNHIERLEQSSDIKNVTIHPFHNPTTLHADIAIIELKQEIYYTEGVKPLCILAPTEEEEELKPRAPKGKKRTGIVYGWGLTEKLEHADRLKEIDLPIVKKSDCKKAYPGEISSLMFCVGGEQGRDTCSGDSGGAFTLWSTKQMKWFLAGIVSWGETCGRSEKPGVYTRITPDLRTWIYANTDLGA